MWSRINSLLLGCVFAARLFAAERIEALEPHMGTMFRIVLYADDPMRAHSALRAAFDRIGDLDDKLSDYKPESELNKVCREAVGRDVAISADLYTVLKASQDLAGLSDGAFDITVGPLVQLWRNARKASALPAAPDIAAALRLTGYGYVHLGNRTVRMDVAGMQLDLGAIAKGYAADEALRVLREFGFEQALVAASGDIAVGDPPPGKPGWEIGLNSEARHIEFRNAAISTSGDTEQYVEIGRKRYSHIVDPRTGMGLTHRIVISVVASKGIDSDSLATAASVIADRSGTAAALSFIESRGAKGFAFAP